MSLLQVEIQGTLQPDGTLRLDEKPNLPPGKVTVVLRQVSEPAPPSVGWWQVLQNARQRMEEAGCHFMDEKEMAAHIAWLREEDPIDELLRESDEQRGKPE